MSDGGAASSISFLKDFIKSFIWICLSMSKIYLNFSLTKQVAAVLALKFYRSSSKILAVACSKLKLPKSLSHVLLYLGMTVSSGSSICPSTLNSLLEIVPWEPCCFSFVVNTALKYFMYLSKNQPCFDLTCLSNFEGL